MDPALVSPGGSAACKVAACLGVVVRLGDGDAVHGGVELPVADSAEAVSFTVSGPNG